MRGGQRRVRAQVLPADVVWTYSGVRPLYDDGASEAKAASRDYVLELDARPGVAPAAVDHRRQDHDLSPAGRGRARSGWRRTCPSRQGLAAGWTGTTPLPGGEFDPDELPALTQRLARSYPFLDQAHAARLVRAYGAARGAHTRQGQIGGESRAGISGPR